MRSNFIYLTEDQKTMWAEAGTMFPGEQLDGIIHRAIDNLLPLRYQKDRDRENDYYEVRRRDIPIGFDKLLKLQNTGRAKRHMEIDNDGAREVLQVEACLMDVVMTTIRVLLDILLRILGTSAYKPDDRIRLQSEERDIKSYQPAIDQSYIPTWKRRLIEHDGASYTPNH
ncbi:hypothetical protein IFT62_21855 [Pseudomonas lutea]|uniref:Uncharacterized protein n=1 Tax=Pseudomonas lutea TaxID=243924 RepID=A0ABR9ACS0_9PSED|nr:hypothetical protein [Pseudomonas lutea]MBD8123851.1 hypothetical protein [Pseudomonas lutea]